MPSFTKESLETLRNKIDLVEVLEPYVRFTKSGASYKGLCPFHEEKTPSFIVQRGDMHYHCFGCSAHGDAITFLMNYQKLSFQEAVEFLANKFQVKLETSNANFENDNFSKKILLNALDEATNFYNFILLNTKEGKSALKYLYSRGIDLDFIKTFQIGYSLKDSIVFQKYMYEKRIKKETLEKTGLIRILTSKTVDFFSDRIMFPIRDALGSTIGFSARSFKENTFGGKYINTSETFLFKKSKVLFGLNYSRKRIAKEKKAIIVEGQIDALRLIHLGYNITIASQGTSFTKDHVEQLVNLGVKEVFLAFDGDRAGIEAAIKTGDLFQKNAIEVYVVELPANKDPDTFIIEKGKDEFEKYLKQANDYLSFLVKTLSKKYNLQSPSQKNELIQKIVSQIKNWDHPLMIHESLRKLANLTKTPEEILGINVKEEPNIYIKKQGSISNIDVNFDLVLETDLLRILFLESFSNPKLKEIAKLNLKEEYFKITVAKNLYLKFLELKENEKINNLLSLAINLDDAEERLFLSEMLHKKINKEIIEETFINTLQKILDRYWMEKREEIKIKIQSGRLDDDAVTDLAKEFDKIKNTRPKVNLL
ncbi:MAG: DNA primase [Candidatus Anoxychlamydiales bacterium]|nr:DNA primase [Candidatus Anoxychlamydiales bacterium]